MSQENKVSLKASKLEVKKAVLVLSSNQSQLVDESVSLIERVIDEGISYTKTRGELIALISDKFASIMGTNPSYELWNLAKVSIMNPILKARGIDEKSFNSNIWDSVTTYCELNFELVKPKSRSAEAERKAKSRADLDELSDAELKAQGKLVELAKREEKRIKEKAKAQLEKQKDFIKSFNDKMKSLAKEEPAFALWIGANLETLRKQYKQVN
jgi:hypothetical protein